jgi:hypothetical protein
MEPTKLFDFGFKLIRPVPDRGPIRVWSWSIVFRDAPTVIWHIVRRTGNLKRWA